MVRRPRMCASACPPLGTVRPNRLSTVPAAVAPPGIRPTHHAARGILPGGVTRVVLVHGAMDRGRSFSRMVRVLADAGFDCVTYDRRGYESSHLSDPFSKKRPPSITDHAEDLAQVIGDQPSIVFGHSLGGTIALLTSAAGSCAGLSALVTFECPLPWMDFWSRSGAYAMRPGEISEAAAEDFAQTFMERMIGEHRWARLPSRTREQRRAEGPVLAAEMASASHLDPPPDLGAIKVPLFASRGDRAPSRHLMAVEKLATSVPGCEVVIVPETDHSIHLTNPSAAAGLVQLAWQRLKGSELGATG